MHFIYGKNTLKEIEGVKLKIVKINIFFLWNILKLLKFAFECIIYKGDSPFFSTKQVNYLS